MDKDNSGEINDSTELVGAVEVTDEELPHEEVEGEEVISSKRRKRLMSKTEYERQHYRYVNDRVVNDVTVEFFYKPHTISILVLLCAGIIYKAFSDDNQTLEYNIWNGIRATACLFLVLGAMVFPNGPFIRPHPIIWRLVFGLSVIYLLLLQFTLYQSYDNVKTALTWLDPEGLGMKKLKEKDYAVDCWDITLERLWSYMDIFAVGHFLGWAMKAMLIRHAIICWYISISWELTEVLFAHLLPNFQECWWDSIFLDVIVCNGLGIFFGLQVCKFFEIRTFRWESIKNIRTARGKFKRAVLQFTPESWIQVDWFNSFALRRTLALYIFIMIWLISELNTFFLKHVMAIDTSHPVVFWRIILIGLISAPTIRQYYSYVTDPKVKRLGMQCWVFCAVTALESAICIKYGRHQLPTVKITLITIWILLLVIGTVFCVWLSVWWAKSSSLTQGVKLKDGVKRHFYLDSSYENLGVIHDDVRKRRKQLNISESDF